jgi:hypothetical protein
MGIDFTLERYLDEGLYFLLTASVFDSKYTANDGIERNTRFNKNYVLNALIGKEWKVGSEKNNLISANIRFNYLGGNRLEAIDRQSSLDRQEIIYGETNGDLSFSQKLADIPIASFTISYRINSPNHSSVLSLQVLNANGAQEFGSNFYNLKTNMIDSKYSNIIVPNLSYKLEF